MTIDPAAPTEHLEPAGERNGFLTSLDRLTAYTKTLTERASDPTPQRRNE